MRWNFNNWALYIHKQNCFFQSSTQVELNQQYSCHESGYHSLKLHITHGLHLPACTALTHSRPPLHQSHSCHHSLINPDCLTTPAPHSLTHIKAAHKHSLTAKSCFALATFLSVLPRICYRCVWPRTARPTIPEPVPVTSTPAWYCLRLCFASDLPVFACWPLPVWFCPRLINIGAIGSACLRPLPYNSGLKVITIKMILICMWATLKHLKRNRANP